MNGALGSSCLPYPSVLVLGPCATQWEKSENGTEYIAGGMNNHPIDYETLYFWRLTARSLPEASTHFQLGQRILKYQ